MTTLSSLKFSSQHSSPLIWESTFTLVENLINTYILILWEYWTSTCLYHDYIIYIIIIKSTAQPWFGSLFVLSSVYKYNCCINGIKSYRIEILTLCTLSFSLAYWMCIFIYQLSSQHYTKYWFSNLVHVYNITNCQYIWWQIW